VEEALLPVILSPLPCHPSPQDGVPQAAATSSLHPSGEHGALTWVLLSMSLLCFLIHPFLIL